MISSKKVVIEPTAGVNEAKICPKIAENCKYSYFPMQLNYPNIIQYFNIFLCFSEKVYLANMISSRKVVIKPTAGVKEAKICPKLVKKCVYSYLQ